MENRRNILTRVLSMDRAVVVADAAELQPLDTTGPLGNLMSLGGSLVGTCTALQGIDKYAFLVGRKFPVKFPVKMMAGNVAMPSEGVLGSVGAEVHSANAAIAATAIRACPRRADYCPCEPDSYRNK